MPTIDQQLMVILALKDELFKQGVASAEKSLRAFGGNMTAIGMQASMAFLGLGAAVVGAAKSFGDFQAGMANVSTLVDTSKENMAAMSKQVLEMATRSPVAIHDLTDGLYDIRSAGIDASHAMGTLDASVRLSVAGLSTVKEATDLMTSAINAFRDEGLSANQIANIFFKSVQYGKQTVSQMAEAFGATAPLVHSAGVSLEEYAAAVAAITTVGTPAAQAENQLRAAIVSLKKPTDEMATILHHLGAKSGPDFLKSAGNVGNAFKAIYQEADRSGIALEKATGRVEGAAAITAIATSVNQAYNVTLKDIKSGTDALGAAFEKQKATFESSIKILINNLQVLAIQIGESLAPALSQMAQAATKALYILSGMPKPLQDILAGGLLVGTVLTGLIAVFGLLSGAVLTGMANLISFTTWLIKTPQLIQEVEVAIIALQTSLAGLPVLFAEGTVGATLFSAALGIGTGGLTLIIGGVVTAIAALGSAWQNNWGNIRGITAQSIQFILILAGDLVKAFQDMGGLVFDIIQGTLENIYDTFKSVFTGIGDLLQSFIGFFKQLFNTLPPNVQHVFSDIVAKAGAFVKGMFSAMGPLIGLFQRIGNALSPIGSAIANTWNEAGKKIDEVTKKSKAAASANDPFGIMGKMQLPNVNLPSGGKKGAANKAARAEQKAENAELKQSTEDLTHALKANQEAMDGNIASMGSYVTEGMKLSEQLKKLDADEKTLLTARQKVATMHFTGDAEKKRLEELKKINEQIKQNGIDELKAHNDLAKFQVQDALSKALEKDDQALQRNIADMGAYATEGQKLQAELDTLKQKELDIAAARTAIEKQYANSSKEVRDASLHDIIKQQDDILLKEKNTQNVIFKTTFETTWKINDAKEAARQADAKLQDDHLKSLEATELERLRDAYQNKEILARSYYAQLYAIEFQQAQREKEELARQIEFLKQKKAAIEAVNKDETATIEINRQIAALTGQQIALDDNLYAKEKQLNLQRQNDLRNTIQSITQVGEAYTHKIVDGIAQGNLKIKDLFKQLALDVTHTMVSGLFKKIEKGMLNLLKNSQQTTAQMAKSAEEGATAISAVHAKMSEGGIAGWANLAKNAISHIKDIFKMQKLAAFKGAIVDSNHMAILAAKSVAGIPIIGHLLAPIVYAATLAFGLAKSALINAVSFDVGTANVPGDMLANVHEGEIIIPRTFADSIRSGELALSGNGQPAPGGMASNEIHIHISGNNFYGTPEDLLNQLEKLLIRKKNIIGTALGV